MIRRLYLYLYRVLRRGRLPDDDLDGCAVVLRDTRITLDREIDAFLIPEDRGLVRSRLYWRVRRYHDEQG